MVFDNAAALEVYYLWRSEHDEQEKAQYLEEFLELCTSLVEAITWKYSSQMDHEDLIQECTIKLLSAINSYDPTITTLHTFLTTVIINHCNTCVSRESRKCVGDVELTPDIEPRIFQDYGEEEILDDLIQRNRVRFPSLPTETIDEMTELIYDLSKDEIAGKSKGVIGALAERFPINRHRAIVIYHSTLVYIRKMYIRRVALNDVEEPEEFSLLYDFQECFGDEAYARLCRLFSGTFLKLP